MSVSMARMPEIEGIRMIGASGSGATATVFRGHQIAVDRLVAVKTVPWPLDSVERAAMQRRFRREAEALGRLAHRHIAGIYYYGEADGFGYCVQELIDGRSLRSVLEAGERLPLAAIVLIMGQVTSALGHAHQRGVIHSDVKPGNIVLRPDGSAALVDFGIARVTDSNATVTQMVQGTPLYSAPEQWNAMALDERTDIYAAGATMLHLLTWQRPFTGTAEQVIHRQLTEEAPPPSRLDPGLPPYFDPVIRAAMAKDPTRRYATVADFATAIERAWTLCHSASDPAGPVLSPARRVLPSRRSRRRPGLWRKMRRFLNAL
ncbi:MAG: serine/threonine protein kinase [Rhodospirillales bacterium]|nr:serine/threonine protein kinase [Rhodospirillales bacterium]